MPHTTLTLGPFSRGLHDITPDVRAACAQHPGASLCHLFIQHTSASLLIQENADPNVLGDLEAFFRRLVPDGDPLFLHVEEGPDDMSAHIRGAITQTSLSIPIEDGRLMLGTWQGIFLWEHRAAGRARRVVVTPLG
jgi:secondary thiamine-phosphate synthase enzyme